MTLKVELNYANGVPQTAVAGFAPRGIGWHWSAGATGRAGANWVVQHFVNTRLTVNASYHILLFREGKTTVAMWIVPVTRAAHSMNPGAAYKPRVNSAREQSRFTEVRRILGARANDPNAGCIAVSFCGMPADLVAAMKDPDFVKDVRQLESELRAHPAVIARPNFGHGWIQPSNRYEMDASHGGVDLLISALYGEAPKQETDMYDWASKLKPASFRATIAQGAAIRKAPRYKGAASAETILFFASRVSTIDVVGTVQGEDFNGKTEWLAYVVGDRGLALVNAGNETAARQPLGQTVEVIKEVEVIKDASPAQIDNAKKTERDRIAQAEAKRIQSI